VYTGINRQTQYNILMLPYALGMQAAFAMAEESQQRSNLSLQVSAFDHNATQRAPGPQRVKQELTQTNGGDPFKEWR
jgi:hypothetical protein